MLKLMLLLLNDLAAVCFYVINYLFKTTLIVQDSLFRCKKKKNTSMKLHRLLHI